MNTILRKYILLFFAVSLTGINVFAQNLSGSLTGLSLKNNKQPEAKNVRADDIIWKRDVYRMLDLEVSQNATLYYPIEASAEKMNLFSTIFDAIAKGNVTAYEYLDGREVFNAQYAIKFKDLLKKFEIPFKEKTDPRRPGVAIFDIDAIDIPSSEVKMYYTKEVVYLDQRNSSIQTRIMAICPILVRTDEMGETRKYPMFWIPFETIRTHLSEQSVAADSLNSAERLSLYDFFNQRRYKGEIIKVSNLKNQAIMDYCKTPEEIKAEQERLEKQLATIGNVLWEPNQRDLVKPKNKREKKEN